MADKFDPQVFFSRSDNVALSVAASEVFGLLKRSLDLPAAWAALVTRATGDHSLVRAGGKVESADADDLFFVRVSPLEVTIEEDHIPTRDQYQGRAEVRLQVSVIPEAGELTSFRKAILGSRRVVKTEDVERYLQPTIRTALSEFAADFEVKDLMDASKAAVASGALVEALKGPCFAAGLATADQPQVRFESATFREVQQTQQEAARRRAEHEATRDLQEALEQAQGWHLDHLSKLLAQLKEKAADSPDADLPELLRTFSEHQRGELYEALFAAETPVSKTQWIVVAAGEELLFFDPQRLEAPTRRVTIVGEVGPVRSVQTGRDAGGQALLLLGGATGVYQVRIDGTEPELTLSVPGAPSVRGGFNAAAMIGDRVFASHSELGLCEWNAGEPAQARTRFESMTRDAKTVRGVLFSNGALYCTIDDRIINWPADETSDRPAHIYTGSTATITSLCATPDGLLAGNSTGDVLFWAAGKETDPEMLHRGTNRAAESVWMVTTHGVRRVLYADTSPSIHARVLGDSFTCQYEAGGQTLRRVEVAPDLLAATNDLRDRLLLWSTGDPAKPRATVQVSRLCGRSVQDVCLVAHA